MRNLLLVGLVLILAGCLAKDDNEGGTVGKSATFAEVSAVLDANCTECHGPTATADCAGCHDESYSSANLIGMAHADLVNVDSLTVAGAKLVVSGDSANSVLYWVVSGDAKYTGGMGGWMGLSATDAEIIANWIDGGAPAE